MIEELTLHELVVAFFVVVADRVVLIQIECDHILERELAVLVQLDQLLVDGNGGAACC